MFRLAEKTFDGLAPGWFPRFQWPDCATVLDYLVKHRLKGEGYPAFFSEWNSSELVKETTKLFVTCKN
jgi:hypothetical protein